MRARYLVSVLLAGFMLNGALLVGCAGSSLPVQGQEISVFIDGNPWEPEYSPVIEDGRVLVPMRPFCAALGADVSWDQDTRTAVGTRGGREVRIPVDSTRVFVAGRTVEIEVPARIREGRVYIPLRFLGEALGDRVAWDGHQHRIDIFRSHPSDPPVKRGDQELVSPEDFTYRGAFRLPAGGERPLTFAWGGEAMTYIPDGGNASPASGYPGSLLVMGHNRMPDGVLPDGNQVAEIAIPEPARADTVAGLPEARFIQPFHDVAAGHFATLNEIPRAGMEYLDTPETGPLVHLCWGQHLQEPDNQTEVASHAWFHPDLAAPDVQGPWYIGQQSLYSVNDYIFEIPETWAREHAGGRRLATGRFKDGGWSGMGPALFAYCPWDISGAPAAPRTRLEEKTLLLYRKSNETDAIEQCLDGYQHPDEWTGGAWLTLDSGAAAVMLAGTKGTGSRYWYGFIHPGGPDLACVEGAFLGQFPLCRLADGTVCPGERDAVCANPASHRGWWSTSFQARFIFYDPADLARVAAGELDSWEPQPYAHLDIDEHLFFNPEGLEPHMLGTGPQRRYRLGDVGYDRENGFIYVLELFADGATPVVHVWKLESE